MRHIDGMLPTLAVLHPEGDVVWDGRGFGLEDGEVYVSQPHLLLNLGTTVSWAVVATQRHLFLIQEVLLGEKSVLCSAISDIFSPNATEINGWMVLRLEGWEIYQAQRHLCVPSETVMYWKDNLVVISQLLKAIFVLFSDHIVFFSGKQN